MDVVYALHSDSMFIHWHGMHQKNTPGWMAWLGSHTVPSFQGQASLTSSRPTHRVGSGTTFKSGAQRTEGIFGALIVKEVGNTPKLNLKPEEHILSLLDWQLEPSDVLFTRRSKIGFFPPSIPYGTVPTGGPYWVTFGAAV